MMGKAFCEKRDGFGRGVVHKEWKFISRYLSASVRTNSHTFVTEGAQCNPHTTIWLLAPPRGG